MNNLGKRTLTAFVGVPALLCLLIFLPQKNYLAFCLVVFIAAFIGSMEMERLLFKKASLFCLFPAVLPILQYFELYFSWHVRVTDIAFVLIVLGFCVPEIWKGAIKGFESSLEVCAKRTILVFYPSWLLTFVIKILALGPKGDKRGGYFLLMLVLVFANDVFAYIFGRLFGAKNKGIVPASPNKSLAGFLGGALSSILASLILCWLLFPKIGLLAAIGLGVASSLCADLGDLVESLFKRSAKVKDSGNLIPGRGGMLDCLDSIIATAPVFYLFLELLP